MQFQSIHFSKDTELSSWEILELWFSTSLWQCCGFPEMGTIIWHQKVFFKESFVLQDLKYKIQI